MKNIFYSMLLCLFSFSLQCQSQTTRLIVRADDLGSSHAANMAIIKTCIEGIVTSVEVMIPTPWFPEAVKLMQQNPGMDVGVHLTITSEWENIKWRPLTSCPSLVDKDGYFFPMLSPNKNYPDLSIIENPWKLADIEKEFRAQIEMALRNIPRISHLSGHMGCSNFAPEVSSLVKSLAEEYKIGNEFNDIQVEYAGYDGPGKTSEEKVQSFLNRLNKLDPGKTYLFVDHPGLDNAEMQAIYHIGYEDVAADRQGVTDLLTNEKVKALINKKGIQLVSYKDVLR
jgi:predicted glycoside hydrolase/deacetylase ChbG (UPF0249 family)